MHNSLEASITLQYQCMDAQPPPGWNQEPFGIMARNLTPHNRPNRPFRNVRPLFRISATYSTIVARATSFQCQLFTGITPISSPKNGFCHQVRAGVGNVACCSACETVIPLKSPPRTLHWTSTKNTQRR